LAVDDPEVIAVRGDEQLDVARLEPYLRNHLSGAEGAFSIRQFGGGHANLTYLIQFGENEFVLRRPPLGPIAPSAHDMAREHRVLSRLYKNFPLAPRSYHLCVDLSVIGAHFHLMERRRGVVIRTDLPPPFMEDKVIAHRIGNSVVDTLADLHTSDPANIGLGDLGHPEGYLDRQVTGWIGRWEAAQDEPKPAADRLTGWLRENKPAQTSVSLVHNDYKLDNILVDVADPAKFVAVLDWDMCTRGDPLCDLGYLLNWWGEAGDDQSWIDAGSLPSWRDGFPSRADVINRYIAQTGFDPVAIKWHHVFGTFRLAVIIQQIYIRYLRGQTQDRRFCVYGARVATLVEKSLVLAEA
jgi:aminoglycoside phosphotransferase (APT) family kinase protein